MFTSIVEKLKNYLQKVYDDQALIISVDWNWHNNINVVLSGELKVFGII